MSNLPVVQLETAFRWRCQCGALNFVSARKADLSAEELEAKLRESFGISEWEQMPEEPGEFVMAPETVICGKCRATFATKDEP